MNFNRHDGGTGILEISGAVPAICKTSYGHRLDSRGQESAEPTMFDGPEGKSNDRHITGASLRVQEVADTFEFPLFPLSWTWNYELVPFKANHEPGGVDGNDCVAIYMVMATLEVHMSKGRMISAKSYLPDTSSHMSFPINANR